jgi:hypothetical protein
VYDVRPRTPWRYPHPKREMLNVVLQTIALSDQRDKCWGYPVCCQVNPRGPKREMPAKHFGSSGSLNQFLFHRCCSCSLSSILMSSSDPDQTRRRMTAKRPHPEGVQIQSLQVQPELPARPTASETSDHKRIEGRLAYLSM